METQEDHVSEHVDDILLLKGGGVWSLVKGVAGQSVVLSILVFV